MLTALLGMQLYGEMTYTGAYDAGALAERFRRCCDADAQAFLDISLLNAAPGMVSYPSDPANACKFMLYQDPLVELFEADMEPFHLAEHFAGLVPLYARYAEENPAYSLVFEFYTALAHALACKCAWHEQAAKAVRGRDRDLAGELAAGIDGTVEALEVLRRIWRRLWESTNKPNGFEVIEVRLGGVIARLGTAQEKMNAFACGQTDDIPELTEPSLVCKRRPDNSINCTNTMDEIATPSRIDY